jgi:A/G-specific adenine glycosylase
VVRHGFTHFRLELEVWAATAAPATDCAASGAAARWTRPEELDVAALPTLMRKVARHALDANRQPRRVEPNPGESSASGA